MSSTLAKRKRSTSRREEREDIESEDASPSRTASQRRTRKNMLNDEPQSLTSKQNDSQRTPTKSQGVIFLSTADPKLKTPKSGRGREVAKGGSKSATSKKVKSKAEVDLDAELATPTKVRGRRKADDDKTLLEKRAVKMKSVQYGDVISPESLPTAGRSRLSFYDNEDEGGDGEVRDEQSNSDPEPSEDEDEDADSQEDDEVSSPTKRTPSRTGKGKRKTKEPDSVHHVPGFVTQTSFDLYFQAVSIPARTSSSTFTSILSTLTSDEYNKLLYDTSSRQKHKTELEALQASHKEYFSRYLIELRLGFNLLFYGFGSKRRILNEFARSCCAKVGDVVVVNGFRPSLGIKDILNQLDHLRLTVRGAEDADEDVTDTLARTTISGASANVISALDAQAQRIYLHFKPKTGRAPRPVFIIIHNIDSPNLRNAKAKSVLGLLASNPGIHLVGSVDHMNAPLIWTESEALGRGHHYSHRDNHDDDNHEAMEDEYQHREGSDRWTIPSERNFTWLWHDLTTFEHYDIEMEAQGRDLTSIAVSGSGKVKGGLAASGGANSAATGPAGTAGPLTEAGAQQVLSSVTDRSKKLFVLLANKQLSTIEAETSGSGGPNVTAAQMVKHAISYDHLFGAARESFIATSDPALRGLLQEFKDHGMVVMGAASGGGGGEVIWIPLARNVLERLLEGVEA